MRQILISNQCVTFTGIKVLWPLAETGWYWEFWAVFRHWGPQLICSWWTWPSLISCWWSRWSPNASTISFWEVPGNLETLAAKFTPSVVSKKEFKFAELNLGHIHVQFDFFNAKFRCALRVQSDYDFSSYLLRSVRTLNRILAQLERSIYNFLIIIDTTSLLTASTVPHWLSVKLCWWLLLVGYGLLVGRFHRSSAGGLTQWMACLERNDFNLMTL